MSLQHRLAESQETGAKTDNERLYDEFEGLKSQIRSLENELKKLRPDIDELMARGELVGYPDAYLTLQESTRYEVDQELAQQVLGKSVWARVSEVSGKKLKNALEMGLVKQAEFDRITAPKVTTSLVPKTTAR